MAVTKKSVGTGNNPGSSPYSATAVSSESPSPTAIGDVVVFFVGNDGNPLTTTSLTVTGSPTLNLFATANPGGANNSNGKFLCYWYVANTAGPQTVTWMPVNGSDDTSATVYVLGGADPVNPIDAVATGGISNPATATPWPAPSVSPASTNAFLIAGVGSNMAFHGRTVTVPAALTQDANASSSSSYRYAFASTTLSASGATGVYNFVPSGAEQYVSLTVAIKASGPAGLVVTPTGIASGEAMGTPAVRVGVMRSIATKLSYPVTRAATATRAYNPLPTYQRSAPVMLFKPGATSAGSPVPTSGQIWPRGNKTT